MTTSEEPADPNEDCIHVSYSEQAGGFVICDDCGKDVTREVFRATNLPSGYDDFCSGCANCATGDERNLATLASLDIDHRAALQGALDAYQRALVEHCTDSLEAEKFAIRAHAEAVRRVKPPIFAGRT